VDNDTLFFINFWIKKNFCFPISEVLFGNE
jgi:hypothetical protein